jgi:hypothetical protein
MTWELPTFDDRWKAKCKTCKFLDTSHNLGYVMRCAARGRPTWPKPNYCIDQRDRGGPCGPTAKLWRPAAATAVKLKPETMPG